MVFLFFLCGTFGFNRNSSNVFVWKNYYNSRIKDFTNYLLAINKKLTCDQYIVAYEYTKDFR